MQELTVIKTKPADSNFHYFEELIPKLYPPEIQKLKQLESFNTTLLHIAFVVLKNAVPMARCCLYINQDLIYEDKKACCFGNFESVNDLSIVQLLLDTLTIESKSLGVEFLLGPMNGSTWDTYRLSKNSSQSLFFLEPYYPDYYSELLIHAGFSKIAKYVTNKDSTTNLNTERIKKVEKRFIKSGLTFRNINLNDYEEELKKLHVFCMSAFKNNFLFTPITEINFIAKYQKVKPFINPQYVIIAEDKTGRIVGFIFCLENFYDKTEKGIIVKTLAKSNSIRYGGMGNVLGSMFKARALKNGFNYILHAFMKESNASRSLSEHFEGETIREYYLYAKAI